MVPRLSAKVEDRACNSDDPPRADEVRDGTGSTETARHAAKLAGHVEHDTRLSAGAGICTPMLESVGISGTQPWCRSTSDDAGLQICADAACGRPASTIPGALRARTTPRTRVGPRASLLSRHEAVHFAPDLACSLVISTSLGVQQGLQQFGHFAGSAKMHAQPAFWPARAPTSIRARITSPKTGQCSLTLWPA